MIAIKKVAALVALTLATGLFGIKTAGAAVPVQHWTQPSGAAVYLVESPGIPMVDVQIDFDAGSRRDPPAQAGLASAMAAMSGRGVAARNGEPALDENALGEAWADLGASFFGAARGDRTSFLLRSLTDPAVFGKAVALAARQLGEPAFDAAVWERERQRRSAAIAESLRRPATVADQAFRGAVYGSHPYGYTTTAATLAAIAPDDLRAFHARHLLACGARVSIVGALDRAQADAMATRLLARLPQGPCTALPPVAEVAPLAAARDVRIPFASAQAHVLVGQPGYRIGDPDHYALTLGNYVLGGGGFVSRLTEQVREQRGLAYDVSSGFTPGRHAGSFAIGLQTKPEQAAAALALVQQVLARFVAEGPTAAELQAAKDNLVGGFPLRLDSNRKLLEQVANLAWHQLPLNYLDTWSATMSAVTAEQVRAAFARALQPQAMVTVVVGGGP